VPDRAVNDKIQVYLSSPAEPSVIAVVRNISYQNRPDQPRVSEILDQLTRKMRASLIFGLSAAAPTTRFSSIKAIRCSRKKRASPFASRRMSQVMRRTFNGPIRAHMRRDDANDRAVWDFARSCAVHHVHAERS
jgi:hypothetical protein